jgi:hypothetical protein
MGTTEARIGNAKPRLLRNTLGKGFSASAGAGRLSVITAYQKNNCTTKGTLRIPSIYPAASFASSQLSDNRANPINAPNIVEKIIASVATRKVLKRPTARALR